MTRQDLSLYQQTEGFLRTQLEVLLEPYEIVPVGPDIDQDTVDRVLNRINGELRRNYKHVYQDEAMSHVSLQIQALERMRKRRKRQSKNERLPMAIDLHTIVDKASDLPLIQDDDDDSPLHKDPQYERYKQLRQQLIEMNEARKYALEERDSYLALSHVLGPLKKDNKTVRQMVQPNVYSARAEVAVELDRLRVLTARVSAKLASNNSNSKGKEKERQDQHEDEHENANKNDSRKEEGDEMEQDDTDDDDDDDKALYHYDTTHDLFINFDKL